MTTSLDSNAWTVFATVMAFIEPVAIELIIFAVTLVFAVTLRLFSGKRAPEVAKAVKAPPSPVNQSHEPKHYNKYQEAFSSRKDAFQAVSKPAACQDKSAVSASMEKAPSELLDEITEIARDQHSHSHKGCSQVLQMYAELLQQTKAKGLSIPEVACASNRSASDLYAALVYCIVRASRFNMLNEILDDMYDQGIARSLHFYESTMKQLAGAKRYKLALSVYDRMELDGLQPSLVTLSCLVNFAVEVGELKRAVTFFDRLASITTPSIRAYMTLLRVHSMQQDWPASRATIQDMNRRKVSVDSLALNMALGTGIIGDEKHMEEAEKLVEESSVADTISYNILAKGHAHRYNVKEALQVIPKIRARKLRPNSITYNTVMDAAVRSGALEEAWNLLVDMEQERIKPDKFSCSILVKSLAKDPKASYVKKALALVGKVSASCDKSVLSNMYHTVFEAASQDPSKKLAQQVFAEMRVHEVEPNAGVQRFMMQALTGAAKSP